MMPTMKTLATVAITMLPGTRGFGLAYFVPPGSGLCTTVDVRRQRICDQGVDGHTDIDLAGRLWAMD